MFRVVFLQLAVTLMAALIAGAFVGLRGAMSAGLGGMVCVVPNLVFAAHLSVSKFRSRSSFAKNFLLGEFVKLAMTVSLLVGVARIYADVHWPSMLFGLVLATQAVLLLLWKKRTDHVDGS